MKTAALTLAALLAVAQIAVAGQTSSTTHKKKVTHHMAAHKAVPKKQMNTFSQLQHDRKTNHTVRQVTPSPKKSVGTHANNLSKNVNHEVNRESKDVNKFFQGKKKNQ